MKMWGSYARRAGAWAALGLLSPACGERDARFDRAVGPVDVASVTDHVVFVDRGRSEAILLDVSRGASSAASPAVVPLPLNPTLSVPRNEHPDQLLVISRGQPDDGVAAPELPGLSVVDASGKSRTFRYESPFDALAQSDDGKRALLYYTTEAGDRQGSLFNPNEVAIVDLDASGTPDILTPRNLGGTIQRVEFSPPGFSVEGAERHLAVTLFGTYLNILDLDHLDLSEFSVPLSGPRGTAIALADVLFSEAEPKLYVRAKGSNDVFVVTLSPRAAEDGKNDFAPSVTQLPAGNGPSDIALYKDGDTPRLLVASPGSKEVVIVDSDSNNVTSVPLGTPGTNILLFDGPSPTDVVNAPRALLYAPGSQVVTFIDLARLSEKGVSNIEQITVGEPYGAAIRLSDHTVMLPHTGTGLSVLDLWDRTVSVIAGPNLATAVADERAQKLWLAHGDRVGYLDLTRGFHPNEVRVDAPIEHLVMVASKSPKVVVTHASTMGFATVLDASNPTNLGEAFAVRGFYFDKVLQGDGR